MIELIRPVLNHPLLYEGFHFLIGAHYRSRVLVNEYIRPERGHRILDIGCGPGNMVPFLPQCQYVGIDASNSYIALAQRRYCKHGEFICARVGRQPQQRYEDFDIVLALGLVHHLSDEEARELFRLGFAALKPGGRMITNDGCYTPQQSGIKRYLLSRDRGKFVRTQEQYLALARTYFSKVTACLREDVLNVPYTHLIMECRR